MARQGRELLVAIVNARWEGGRSQRKKLEELYERLQRTLEE